MKDRYTVLRDERRSIDDPNGWTIQADGPAWLGFAFPIPWLLAKRLWLHAVAALTLLVTTGLVVGAGLLPVASVFVANLATGVLVGLEGRQWVVSRETRRHMVVGTLTARTRREAEDRLALTAALAGSR